jgi:hypothetical protein
MTTPQPDQSKEPRYFTTQERREKFKAYMALHHQGATQPVPMGARWHLLDDPMSLEQCDQLPPARPGIETRTPPVWVKYHHPDRREIVVAKGRFDYDGGVWTARICMGDDSDYIGPVTPMAWAQIITGKLPWEGPVILR